MLNKIGFVITMYDEKEIVIQSINNIKKYYKDSYIVIVHSDDGCDIKDIEDNSDICLTLPNLALIIKNKYKIPSYSLVRNYNEGFKKIYESDINFELIVGMTGDTFISDASNFDRRYIEMKNNKITSYISQAIGQDFHAPGSDPALGQFGGRFQHENITDFMPQLFFIDGQIAINKNAFTQIKVINEFTSEHCLGDELVRVVGKENFKKVVKRYCNGSNRYKDGIIYQYGGWRK